METNEQLLEARRAEREKRKRNRKIRRIWNAVTTVFVAAVVLLAVLLVGVRVVGLTPYTVLSGSMEPTYHVGSLIYVRAVEPESVEVGDAITFVFDESGTVATHRVVSVDEANGCFFTKGDANEAADAAPVFYENLVGKPLFTIPGLGRLAMALSTTKGMIIAGTVAAILIILAFVPDLLAKAEEADDKEKQRAKRGNDNPEV